MPLPQPEGWEDRFLALERKVNDLFTSIQNQGGVTTASTGLIFPNRSTPSAPGSGGHLHAQGGDPYWTDSSGSTTSLFPPPFPQGEYVSNPPNFASGTASGEDANVINQLRADAAGTKIALDYLLSSLRGAGLISSF